MKVGLLLEGGAMRGLYTAGVLDVFLEKNIQVDGIIGVSAGALFGVNYKSKQKGRVLRYNKKYAKDKRYMGWHSLFTTGNIINQQFCFDELVHHLDIFDFDTYRNSKEEFFAVVTNMETGKAEYIKLDDLRDSMEYLRASGSMPFVSKPVYIDGKQYLDGGIADSIPIDQIMTMGYDKIIVVLTRPIHYRKSKKNQKIPKLWYRNYPKLVETMNHRYLTYNEQVEKVIALEKQEKIFVIRPSKYIPIKNIEKNIDLIEKMYDLGVEDATKILEELKVYLEKNNCQQDGASF